MNSLLPWALLGYVLRRSFRRFWHVLNTGDMEPDWDELGADYFVADWEKRGPKNSVKEEEKAPSVSE